MQCFRTFFTQNPALYYALGFLVFATFFSFRFSLPPLPEEGVVGKAHITFDQLSYKSGPHGPSWYYKGRILHFTDGKLVLQNVPFFLSFPGAKKNRPSASVDYEVQCKIKAGKGNQIILKPLPRTEWKALERFSFTEWRFSSKQKVKEWIESHFSSEATVHFLSGLVIGEFDDKQLKQDFDRFGLLHLLAISGFHFNILAALLTTLLRPFFSIRAIAYLLLFLLSAYFIFLGWGPSIIRAWLTLLLYLGGYFHERFSSPINALGIALILSLACDPLLIENLGFQFSFLTTAAILLLLKPSLDALHRFFPKRPLKTVLEWPKTDQMLYLFLAYLKSGLAMTFVTTLIALPIGFYYFEKFPLLSLFYNIFFPFLVSISMTLLLLGCIFFFIPPLATLIHLANDYFTSFILNMTYEVPRSNNFFIYLPQPHPIYMILYMILLFTASIYLQKSKKPIKI